MVKNATFFSGVILLALAFGTATARDVKELTISANAKSAEQDADTIRQCPPFAPTVRQLMDYFSKANPVPSVVTLDNIILRVTPRATLRIPTVTQQSGAYLLAALEVWYGTSVALLTCSMLAIRGAIPSEAMTFTSALSPSVSSGVHLPCWVLPGGTMMPTFLHNTRAALAWAFANESLGRRVRLDRLRRHRT